LLMPASYPRSGPWPAFKVASVNDQTFHFSSSLSGRIVS